MTTTSSDRLAWTEPGVYPVAPGVFRIPLPLPNDGLRAVNVYAIATDSGVTLIDSGWALAESERRLSTALASLGYELGDVDRFLVTHAHRDHYTQAVVLRERFGAQVALGRGEQPTLTALNSSAEDRERARIRDLRECGAESLVAPLMASWRDEDFDLAMWRFPDRWIGPDVQVQVGGRTLAAIATPGHTRGHVVFRDADGAVLFAGDHVLPSITPSIGFEPAPAASPLADYLASLRLLRELPDTMLLPAHGPVTTSVHERIDELVDHHDARLAASQRAVADGAVTAMDVARALLWTRRGRRFAELSLFDQMLAVTETSAHLKVLVATGRLTCDTTGPVHSYAPVEPGGA